MVLLKKAYGSLSSISVVDTEQRVRDHGSEFDFGNIARTVWFSVGTAMAPAMKKIRPTVMTEDFIFDHWTNMLVRAIKVLDVIP